MAQDPFSTHSAQIQLSSDDLAQSLHRVFQVVLQQEAKPWEFLSYTDQAPFLQAARRGPLMLSASDGGSVQEAACRLARIGCAIIDDAGSWEQTWNNWPLALRLAWEAMTRHLNALIDADELPSLEDLERSWGLWAQKRIAKATSAEGMSVS